MLEWRARVRFELHAVHELARKRETVVGRQNKGVLSDGIKCSRHGRTVNRVFNAVEFRENARSGLTLIQIHWDFLLAGISSSE